MAPVLALAVAGAGMAGAQARFPGVGRPATPAEVRAWDIDVRPDFAGLPKGAGSVAKGQEVWEAKCASCHGVFGESNQVFPPIVGGTTPEDVRAGRVAALRRASEQRTTLMKLSTVSTLWDYVNRAMPWDTPKTLTTEEVYALVAYVLHLGDLVPADFVLSDQTMAAAQARLPNRDGMTRGHGLWDIAGKPDVRGSACMKDCPAGTVTSALPPQARNAHGNLMAQNRIIGPVRGADTTQPPLGGAPGEVADLTRRAALTIAASTPNDRGLALAERHACLSCHAVDDRRVGPSFREIAGKYRRSGESAAFLIGKMKAGGVGTWGAVPMPPQAHVGEDDLTALARWILVELK